MGCQLPHMCISNRERLQNSEHFDARVMYCEEDWAKIATPLLPVNEWDMQIEQFIIYWAHSPIISPRFACSVFTLARRVTSLLQHRGKLMAFVLRKLLYLFIGLVVLGTDYFPLKPSASS
jgi:hypothetical protein